MPNHLKDSDVRWALRHLNEFGDTDLFPRPFELGIMAENQAKVIAHVRALDLPQYKWSEPRRALVLKDELAFRSATQLDPLDAVVFAALIRHDCKRLDARRGDDHESRVFSYGVEPRADGQLYGKDRYREFWQRNAELAAEHAVVLTTDITDFYNQIYHHTIEQELRDAGVSSDAFHAYVNLLRKSSVTTSRGIPIGPHGAHLLAEVALRQLDDLLVQAGFTFTRFVDDIHVFCASKKEARLALYQMVQVLDLVKLQLNRRKTKIRTATEFHVATVLALADEPINADEGEIIAELDDAAEGYAFVPRRVMTPELMAALSPPRVIGIVEDYLDADDVDFIRLRRFFRRLTQTCEPSPIDLIVSRFAELAPAVADAIRFLRYALPFYFGNKAALGAKLLDVLEDPVIATNPYLRLVVLSLFASVAELNHLTKLFEMFDSFDPMARREVILAATNAVAGAWLRKFKSLDNQDPWGRRAVFLASSTWPEDERQHWKRSLKGSYGFLDQLILDSLPTKNAAKVAKRRIAKRPKRMGVS